jgi:hypothetical protein
MKPALFYRIAAVLLLLFAVGHTTGFTHIDPKWGVDTLIASMRSIHFDAAGASRTYWDFYLAFGYSITALLLLSAALAWQLGALPAETLSHLRAVQWAFALCFAALSLISWRLLFVLPCAFSAVVTVCLIVAAWPQAKR